MMLHNQPMERVLTYKYLGVIICNDLSWPPHIDKITRQLISMLYRRFNKINGQVQVHYSNYTSILSGLIFEYSVQVWSPYLLKDIQKLESVQKFALKVCLKKWNSVTVNYFVKVGYLSSQIVGNF